jgi:hypothetical protein
VNQRKIHKNPALKVKASGIFLFEMVPGMVAMREKPPFRRSRAFVFYRW